jgi:hypothetical protein
MLRFGDEIHFNFDRFVIIYTSCSSSVFFALTVKPSAGFVQVDKG